MDRMTAYVKKCKNKTRNFWDQKCKICLIACIQHGQQSLWNSKKNFHNVDCVWVYDVKPASLSSWWFGCH